MAKFPRFTESDVTPESVFQQRRSVLKALGITAASLALPMLLRQIFFLRLRVTIAQRLRQANH